ncbi:MAG: hypothetical protein R2815_02155 [Flavobacteriales bacterium]
MRLALLFLTAAVTSSLAAQTKTTASSDHFVFSTNSKWSAKQVTYDGKTYNVKVTKKCKDETEAPGECYWIVDFQSEAMPKMRCNDEPTSFTTEDINMDGTNEIVAPCSGHGAWVTLHVFTWGDPSMTSGPFWYEPIDSFEWYSGFEGDRVCDAQIFWMKDKNSVKVLTTNPAEEDFKCTDQKIMPWVLK